MPPFMLRSRPFWIVIASCGSIMPVARAEEPPCPSQNVQPSTTAAAGVAAGGANAPAGAAAAPPGTTAPTAAATAATAAPGAAPTASGVGPINITSDEALLGVDGNATL